MSDQIAWKTPDGSRPSVYHMLTVIWKSGPPWLPFLFTILFIVIVWFSGLLYINYGPDVDLTRISTAQGHFQRRPSLNSPYTFVEVAGSKLRLVCQPRMLKSFCLDNSVSDIGTATITYAPFKQSLLKRDDGVVLGVEARGIPVVNQKNRINDLTADDGSKNSPIWIRLFGIVANIPFLFSILLLIFGMIDGIGRIIKPSKIN